EGPDEVGGADLMGGVAERRDVERGAGPGVAAAVDGVELDGRALRATDVADQPDLRVDLRLLSGGDAAVVGGPVGHDVLGGVVVVEREAICGAAARRAA